jgi:hypothetical protein
VAEGASTVAEGALAAVDVSRCRGRRDGQAVEQSCRFKIEEKCRGREVGWMSEAGVSLHRHRHRGERVGWRVDVHTWHAGLR